VDNSCLVLPTEGKGVVSVGSVGPSKKKADYSNWGTHHIDVTAPGGWFRDGFGTPTFRAVSNQILSAYPESIARARNQLNDDGTPRTTSVVRDCQGATCAYYQWIQGTSMASPHAVGVAALIVSRWGGADSKHGGLTLHPRTTERVLWRTATFQPCPTPPLITYANEGRDPSFNALCQGTPWFNNIYGHGIVDALTAVTDCNG